MPAPSTPIAIEHAPRVAQIARTLCYALAILGAAASVGASMVADRWEETLVQVSWILIGSSAVSFVVMLAALWFASHFGGEEASAFHDSQLRR